MRSCICNCTSWTFSFSVFLDKAPNHSVFCNCAGCFHKVDVTKGKIIPSRFGCVIFFIRNAIYPYFCTLASADTHASTHLNTFFFFHKNVQFLWCVVSYFVCSIIAHLQMQRSEKRRSAIVRLLWLFKFQTFSKEALLLLSCK